MGLVKEYRAASTSETGRDMFAISRLTGYAFSTTSSKESMSQKEVRPKHGHGTIVSKIRRGQIASLRRNMTPPVAQPKGLTHHA